MSLSLGRGGGRGGEVQKVPFLPMYFGMDGS